MRRSLAVGMIAAIAWSCAMAGAPRSRPAGAAMPTHRAAAPSAHHGRHAAPRPAVVVQYVPVVRMPTPHAGSSPRPAAPVSAPYFVVSGSPPAREIMTFTEAEPPRNWNWTRVDSVVALVPRKVRYTCPDSREVFPAVGLCASPWLEILP